MIRRSLIKADSFLFKWSTYVVDWFYGK